MTVEQFSYLREPSKIRAAIINAGGPRLSVEVIKRKLVLMTSRRVAQPSVGEPIEGDGQDFRVSGLVQISKPLKERRRDRQRERLSEVAKTATRPEKRETFRYKALPSAYAGTAYASNLIDRVCDELFIPREALRSESRQKFLVAARALIVRHLRHRNEALYSYPRLAQIIGRGDHSTTINLMRKFEHYCTLYPEIAALYLKLQEGGE